MTSTWQSIKSFFGFEPIEFEPLSTYQHAPKTETPFKSNLINTKNTRQFSVSEIKIETPKVYEDATQIATQLRENNPVIVNLKHLDTDTSKRLIDFICGTAYAINGHMMKIGESIFLFTPANVNISNNTPSQSPLESTPTDTTQTPFFKHVSNL